MCANDGTRTSCPPLCCLRDNASGRERAASTSALARLQRKLLVLKPPWQQSLNTMGGGANGNDQRGSKLFTSVDDSSDSSKTHARPSSQTARRTTLRLTGE